MYHKDLGLESQRITQFIDTVISIRLSNRNSESDTHFVFFFRAKQRLRRKGIYFSGNTGTSCRYFVIIWRRSRFESADTISSTFIRDFREQGDPSLLRLLGTGPT